MNDSSVSLPSIYHCVEPRSGDCGKAQRKEYHRFFSFITSDFLDAEPLSNAEVVLLLNDRARELSKVHATVPQSFRSFRLPLRMIRDTLRDCTAAVNSGPELPSNSVKSKKEYLCVDDVTA